MKGGGSMEKIKSREWQSCLNGKTVPCSQVAGLLGVVENNRVSRQELEEDIIQTANKVRACCQAHQLINSGSKRYDNPKKVRSLACVLLILQVTNRLGGFMEGPVYDAEYETRA